MPDFAKYLPIIRVRYPDYRFSWEILTELILKHVASEPYWLDIGAGSNVLIEEQPGASFAVGLDIEKPVRFFVDSRSSYCLAAAENLPFKNNSFDFITSRYTFEHLKHPDLALKQILRILKPGGTLVMQTTNVRNPIVCLARLIPLSIKKLLFKILKIETPSGVFKTYYRINKPIAIKPIFGFAGINGKLKLNRLILVEDIICHSRILFTLTFQLYKLLRFLKSDSLMGNMIAVFEKTR